MRSQAISQNTEATILARIIESDDQPLTPDVARYLLAMRLNSDEERANECPPRRAGSLAEIEAQELDSYLHVGFLLGTVRAKARRLLATIPTPTSQ